MLANAEGVKWEADELFDDCVTPNADPDSPKLTDFTIKKPGSKVTLVAEGKEIRVNKEVLSYFSNYFNTLLGSKNFMEADSDSIEIKHNYEQLLMCMEIAHGINPREPKGKLELSSLRDLILSADRFDLPVVRNYCEAELFARRKGQLVEAFHIASQFNFKAARKHLMEQITATDVREWMNSSGARKMEQEGGELDLSLSGSDLHILMRLAGDVAVVDAAKLSVSPLDRFAASKAHVGFP